jgi:curli biogenesis system outer membrane secretion channel CsgG
MKKFLLLFIAGFISIVYTSNGETRVNNPEIQGANEAPQTKDESPKRKIAIACFSNETQYKKGISRENTDDPMGRQAMDILASKLEASEKFILAERRDMDKILENLKMPENNVSQEVGAEYLLVGSVTEFGSKKGRKTNGKTIETTVRISLIDVLSGEIICSGEAEGEAKHTGPTGQSKNNEYDLTVGEKAISEAITKLVDPIINSCIERPWKTFIVNYDLNGIVIAGGESQGLKFDEILEIVEKSKTVENPQTGKSMTLPEQVVGKIQIVCFAGNTPENEFALTTLIEGDFDTEHLNRYYIKEIKD